jgi:hypothetical protein
MTGLVLGEFAFALRQVEFSEDVHDLNGARKAITVRALPDAQHHEGARVTVARQQILSVIDQAIAGPGSDAARVNEAMQALTALAKAAANE